MQLCGYNLLFGVLVMMLIGDSDAARAGGAGRGKLRGIGRLYSSRMPILIPHRTQAEINYYEHKDVCSETNKYYTINKVYFQGAKIIKSSHFELDYMLGRKITFFCMAQGLPRPEITWFKDGIELYAHKFFQVHEWPLGNDTMKSKMEIDPTTQKDAGYYECQADNQYAIDRRGFRTDYVMINF